MERTASLKVEEKVNSREWRFVGLSRSGNHAIINWVIGQLDRSFCFLNCVEPKTNPWLTCRPFNERGECVETNINNFNIIKERAGDFSEKDFLLYSYEDCFLRTLNHRSFRDNREEWLGNSEERKDILILRDAFNLFASRIRSGLLLGHETHHGVKGISVHALKTMYKQHAREYLGLGNNLRPKVCVLYNDWVKSALYRQTIADELQLDFNDRGMLRMSECAGGSSFDGDFLHNPGAMKLEDRWKNYADSGEYWSLFDEELVEYVYAIFGESEAVDQWRKRQSSIKPSLLFNAVNK